MEYDQNDTFTCQALQRKDLDAIRQRVLSEPGYLKSRDYIGNTPLLTVIAHDCLELVELMLLHGADPNIAVDDGYTCLLTAIESEGAESDAIVARLIESGANIHKSGINGWTPLHMAAARNQLKKAARLLDAGAQIDQRKEIDGEETPLMEAAYCGHPEMVKLLLDRGANPALRETVSGHTPLEIAQHAARGADPSVYECLKKEEFALDPAELFSDVDLPPDQLEIVKGLLQDVDLAESYRKNANQLAREGNHAEVIRILSEYGKEPESP